MHKNADTKEMFDCSQLEPQSDAAREDLERVCRRGDALVLWHTGKEEGDNRIPTKAMTSRAAGDSMTLCSGTSVQVRKEVNMRERDGAAKMQEDELCVKSLSRLPLGGPRTGSSSTKRPIRSSAGRDVRS